MVPADVFAVSQGKAIPWWTGSYPISTMTQVSALSRSAPGSSCASARCRRSTTRTYSSIWGATPRSYAPIARPYTGSTRPWRPEPRAPRSAHFRKRKQPEAARCGCEVTSDGVLIAGAGIGGLTAALALGRRGIGVTVLEQAEKLEEAGAGIQLAPNATRVLVALGLAERLEAAIVQPSAIRLRSGPPGPE